MAFIGLLIRELNPDVKILGVCEIPWHSCRSLTLHAEGGIFQSIGDVAQLGERRLRKSEAEGSNPFISNLFSIYVFDFTTHRI